MKIKTFILTLFLSTTLIIASNDANKTKDSVVVNIEKQRDIIFQTGKASYYGSEYKVGRRTASGQAYDKNKLTAAHKTLPFGTKVLVKNKKNNKEVTVTINDRGPFVKGRVIDLSVAAAKKIGMLHAGVVEVELMFLD